MPKKTITLLLATAFLAACGANEGGNTTTGSSASKKGEATTITIYAGGSSEYSWTKGSEEADVIRTIQDRYYEDTGRNVKFNISYLGQDMKTKIQSTISSGGNLDVCISHTRGGDGIDDYVLKQDLYRDIYDDICDYAPNLQKYIEGEAMDSITTDSGKVIGIPSVIDGKKYGILVRKDWMEACGYTDDAAKVSDNMKLVDSIETFEAMCLAMKTKYNLGHVITGAIWDMEKVLTVGPYGNAGYFTYGFNNGKVVPGFCTSSYRKTIDLEYRWASEGLYSQEWSTILVDTAVSNFVSGKTGVFVCDPTIQHLIKVARQCKSVNDEAEFTVLGALPEKSGGTTKGFMENSVVTFAACLLNTSKNVKTVLQFLNWVYKNEDNYNLCRYGVEGVHWIDNGDGTYSYPEGKESYLTNPPYSGILTLVENQNISNLTYKGYSDEEKSWIATAKNPDNYFENSLTKYMWPMTDATVNSAYSTAIAPVYGSCVEYWNGVKESSRAHDLDGEISTFMTSANGTKYINYLNSAYDIMKVMFGD